MTVNRQWQHTGTTTDSKGVAWVAGYAVSGDRHVSGGGYAEVVDSSNSNESSTETNGNSAYCPMVGMYTEYDSGSGNTYLKVAFQASPNTRLRVHTFTTWEV